MPYFAKSSASQQALLNVLQRVPAIVEKEGGIKLDNVQGEITVEGIEFAYPSRPHITVLRDFNLKIKAGKSLALGKLCTRCVYHVLKFHIEMYNQFSWWIWFG